MLSFRKCYDDDHTAATTSRWQFIYLVSPCWKSPSSCLWCLIISTCFGKGGHWQVMNWLWDDRTCCKKKNQNDKITSCFRLIKVCNRLISWLQCCNPVPKQKRMRLPSDSLPAKMSVGGPTKVLHEAEGHTGMCETSADEASHGSLVALPVVHRQSKAELVSTTAGAGIKPWQQDSISDFTW